MSDLLSGFEFAQGPGGCRAFFEDILGMPPEFIWPKMDEMMDSITNHRKTAVKAGHSVSKSYTVARIALWFLLCHPPATVVTTAPTNTQVEDILWREIREAHAGALCKLPGKVTRTKVDIQDEEGIKWFATGFATKPDTVTQQATAFQGFHNQNFLVIFDEAAGILPQIWRAAMSLCADEGRMLVIGNPTANFGDFVDCFQEDSGWNQITISVRDTPNYIQDKRVIPGLSGRQYERDIIRKFGDGSNEHKIRVLGEFPEYTEGTYYGIQLAKAKAEKRSAVIGLRDETAKTYTFWDIGHAHTAIWFAQFIRREIHIIDYYEDNQGLGLPAYAKVLDTKPYIYGDHYGPWDIGPSGSNSKSFQTGKVVLDVAAELGIHFTITEKSSVDDGIEAVRGMFNKVVFANECREGLAKLGQYKRKKNESLSTDDKPIFYKEPLKNGSEHCADAFRTLAMAYRYSQIDDERIGYPGVQREIEQVEEDVYEALML